MISATRFFRAVSLIVGACSLLVLVKPAVAQQQPQQPNAYEDRKREVNENVVTIMASGISSPYTVFAEDMQNVLDEPGGLRVVPMLGRGGATNALDVLLLRGVDMGILEQSDLDEARKKDPAVFANVENRLHYIAKLANSELQLLARKDVATLAGLEGKKVNCFKKGSSTGIVCERLFALTGIKAEIVYLDQAEANAKLKSGEIAAAMRFAGAPHNAFTGFKASDNVHFLAVDSSSVAPDVYGKLLEIYVPALLRNDHFPELIPGDRPVSTISGAMLLVVYNWPTNTERYRRVENFVNEFFSKIEKFNAPGRHPKWKEINLAATVPGWTRFKAAQDWLDRWKQAEKQAEQGASREVRAAFEQFLKAQGMLANTTPERRELLFSQFMTWWNARNTAQR